MFRSIKIPTVRNKQIVPQARRRAHGAAPGTLTIDPSWPTPAIGLLSYGPDDFDEHQVDDPEQISSLIGKRPVTWVNVSGLGDADILKSLGREFGIHPICLEDVVNIPQRAKLEQYGEYLFFLGSFPKISEPRVFRQVSLFLGKNFVVTFKEHVDNNLEPVRERIRKDIARIRRVGADYLAYAIFSEIVDDYFPVVESYGDRLESLERQTIEEPNSEVISELQSIKDDLLKLRGAIWPMREVVNGLMLKKYELISDDASIYLRDCYDHISQVIELCERYRERAISITDMYLSSVGNKMNGEMRVLTVIATIFLPLTFVAQVTGLNVLHDFPLLSSVGIYLQYSLAGGFMILIALGLLALFRVKGWLR